MGLVAAAVAALGWGVADFIAGRESRSVGAILVACWAQLVSCALVWTLLAVLLATGIVEFKLPTLLVGIGAGCVGALALIAFFGALARGPMTLVAPLTSAGVALPVAVGVAADGLPETLPLIGIGCVVAGIIGISGGERPGAQGAEPERRPALRLARPVVIMTLAAAAGFAVFQVLLDAAGADSVSTAVLAVGGVRIGGSAATLLAVAIARRRLRDVPRRHLGWIAVSGVADATANLAFATGAALATLALVAPVGSSYPAVTAVMAAVLLHERPSRIQVLGIALALLGAVLLATG